MKKLALRCGVIMLAMLMSVVTLLMTACNKESSDEPLPHYDEAPIDGKFSYLAGIMNYDQTCKKWYLDVIENFDSMEWYVQGLESEYDEIVRYYFRPTSETSIYQKEGLTLNVSGVIYSEKKLEINVPDSIRWRFVEIYRITKWSGYPAP